MFIMLGCLAVAMTACALVLDGLSPSATVLIATGDFAPPDSQASAALASTSGAALANWRGIQIVPDQAAYSDQTGYPTARPLPQNHFSVSKMGRIRANASWKLQMQPVGRRAWIAIALIRLGDENTVPPAQWNGIRALILALKDRRPASADPWPVRVATSLCKASPIAAAALQDLLTHDGFSTVQP